MRQASSKRKIRENPCPPVYPANICIPCLPIKNCSSILTDMNARIKVSKNEGKATHIVNSSPCISYRRNISHGLGHARKLRNNQYKRLSHQKRLARAFRDPTAFHFLGCNLSTVLSKVL